MQATANSSSTSADYRYGYERGYAYAEGMGREMLLRMQYAEGATSPLPTSRELFMHVLKGYSLDHKRGFVAGFTRWTTDAARELQQAVGE